MSYSVEVSVPFVARQGLRSPVRAANAQAPAAPEQGFSVVLRAGVSFQEEQLNDRGWFVDTDAVETALQQCAKHLAGDSWTHLFDFRPTFELIARWAFRELEPAIPGLEYVTLENATLGVLTKYAPTAD